MLVSFCARSFCARPRAAIVLYPGLALALLLSASAAFAGGPKYVAGTSYFNSGVLGQPIHWAAGQLNYYVDRGPLSATVSNRQAVAMVDAAAALWSAVPTAAVTLTDSGPLNEDVSGANIVASGTNFTVTNEQIDQLTQIAQPADVTPSATQYPVGVIFDEDGSAIDALFGPGASDPTSCEFNGVWFWIDNVHPDATIAHAILLLNGLCATNANMLAMMSFELQRAFGHILNLDYAQVNPDALDNEEPGGAQGWPVMQPISGVCGSTGGDCIPQPSVLHSDDIAALIVSGGVSYDSGTGDALTLLAAPMNTVPIGVPIPFTVTALTPSLIPASGVTVIYTVTSGTASLRRGDFLFPRFSMGSSLPKPRTRAVAAMFVSPRFSVGNRNPKNITESRRDGANRRWSR